MNDMSEMSQLQALLRQFRDDRDWKPFHTPKNLACALSVEASELLEHFQWLTDGSELKQTPESLQAVKYEMADVLNYLLMLADELEVDLCAVAKEKIQLNARKYPVESSKGSCKKYDQL